MKASTTPARISSAWGPTAQQTHGPRPARHHPTAPTQAAVVTSPLLRLGRLPRERPDPALPIFLVFFLVLRGAARPPLALRLGRRHAATSLSRDAPSRRRSPPHPHRQAQPMSAERAQERAGFAEAAATGGGAAVTGGRAAVFLALLGTAAPWGCVGPGLSTD